MDSGLEAMGTQKQWTRVLKQWELKRNGLGFRNNENSNTMDSGSEQWELKHNGLGLLVSGQEALEEKIFKASKAGDKPSS